MAHNTHKPILGIIGAIGSGKSLIARQFVRHGGCLIEGDQLGHQALTQPDIRAQVIERFGKEICDAEGNIDRRRLGARVFADLKELRALEELVLPFIERRIGADIAQAQRRDDVAFVVLDAAIMLETGWGRVCDKLVFVDAPRSMRLERLKRKHGWSEKEVAAREEMQMDVTLKKSKADFVVENREGPEAIPVQVLDILQRLGLAHESL